MTGTPVVIGVTIAHVLSTRHVGERFVTTARYGEIICRRRHEDNGRHVTVYYSLSLALSSLMVIVWLRHGAASCRVIPCHTVIVWQHWSLYVVTLIITIEEQTLR